MELRRNEERTEDYPPVVSRTRSSDIEQSRNRLARSSRVANAHLFAYSRIFTSIAIYTSRFPFFPLPIYRGMMNRHSQPRASSQRYILPRATRINSAVNSSARYTLRLPLGTPEPDKFADRRIGLPLSRCPDGYRLHANGGLTTLACGFNKATGIDRRPCVPNFGVCRGRCGPIEKCRGERNDRRRGRRRRARGRETERGAHPVALAVDSARH